ncbi:unnamed protein product [Allacma fusca]|uniref:Uncharacterized protein n=1 Tax=Allacma fusca TaxID=39272 RepID=A0A8J2K2X8_9HEXA|nr:unnamed protein product [Allacma fusca]
MLDLVLNIFFGLLPINDPCSIRFPKTENRNNTKPLLVLSKANKLDANSMDVKIVDNVTAIQTTISSGLVYNEIISNLEALTPSDVMK